MPGQFSVEINTEALESYACGRLETPSEIKRCLEAAPAFPKTDEGIVHLQKVLDILDRPIYAGYLDMPRWNIMLQPGKHEPLISFETGQKIQGRLHAKAKAPYRKDLSDDFPSLPAVPAIIP